MGVELLLGSFEGSVGGLFSGGCNWGQSWFCGEGSDGGGRVGHGGCWLEVMEVLQVTSDWQSDYQLIGNF